LNPASRRAFASGAAEDERVPMPEYRIFALTSDNYIKDVPALVVCQNDNAALEAARKMLDGHDIEVWEGVRRVTRLNSVD
jgi:hypothetical protein